MGIKETFAEKLKKELADAGITQKVLAKRAHISEAYISQILSGKRTPTIAVAKRIAEALGKPVSYFLEDNFDVRIFLRKSKNLSEEDIKAVEAFIDYLIEKKNNEKNR